MSPSLSDVWRRHRPLVVALGLALLVTLFFGVRLVRHALFWEPDMPLQGWMTIGQIAHSYDVPREDLAAALGLEPGIYRRLTVDEIARQTGRTVPEVEEALLEAIAKSRPADPAE